MPTRQPLRLVVLAAHAPRGRGGRAVAGWALERLGERADLEVDPVVVATLDLPWELARPAEDPRVAAYAQRIEAADAFVVVTPEYNHSFPGNLKHAIDLVRDGWARKPVGFVTYGGISGGLRAAEQLRLVFAELRAVAVRDTVSFADAGDRFDEHGRPRDPDGPERALTVLVDDLTWWARLLREGRLAGDRAA